MRDGQARLPAEQPPLRATGGEGRLASATTQTRATRNASRAAARRVRGSRTPTQQTLLRGQNDRRYENQANVHKPQPALQQVLFVAVLRVPREPLPVRGRGAAVRPLLPGPAPARPRPVPCTSTCRRPGERCSWRSIEALVGLCEDGRSHPPAGWSAGRGLEKAHQPGFANDFAHRGHGFSLWW